MSDNMKNLNYYLRDLSLRKDDLETAMSLVQRDVLGGRTSVDQIDELKKYPHISEIKISGLKQDTFEYFVKTYGKQFKVITLWKCPLISDFSVLESLSSLEYIIIFWNQRATRLWDFSKNKKLKGLAFDDFTRMNKLDEISKASSLEELSFGDRVWNKYTVESLKPLEKCENLRNLEFTAKKIIDNDVSPLLRIEKLNRLEFPTNLFTTEQVAFLTSKLKHVESAVLAPYKMLANPIKHGDKVKDCLIIGKRKPFLDSNKDRERINKYSNKFNELVTSYESE